MQVNRCFIPTQVNGYGSLVQVNGTCIPAQVLVNSSLAFACTAKQVSNTGRPKCEPSPAIISAPISANCFARGCLSSSVSSVSSSRALYPLTSSSPSFLPSRNHNKERGTSVQGNSASPPIQEQRDVIRVPLPRKPQQGSARTRLRGNSETRMLRTGGASNEELLGAFDLRVPAG